jgi:hypothetical protein
MRARGKPKHGVTSKYGSGHAANELVGEIQRRVAVMGSVPQYIHVLKSKEVVQSGYLG